MPARRPLAALTCALALAAPLAAQQMSGRVDPDGEGGRMTMVMPGSDSDPDRAVAEELIFLPWDMLQELARDDVVLLMRHGPTDWSKRDVVDVAPDDCDGQRIMTETGRRQMYELGALMVANDLRPGRIVVSQWCRNQQTLESMLAGMRDADPAALDGVEIETMADLNLLLSLQGAPDTAAMEAFVAEWDGGDGDGPLLVISHFTNIQEMTERAVFEGQMLLLDPRQENRVLGELRLGSAGPDEGHFQ
jgi:broad specificity phosphatase PhoE